LNHPTLLLNIAAVNQYPKSAQVPLMLVYCYSSGISFWFTAMQAGRKRKGKVCSKMPKMRTQKASLRRRNIPSA